MSSLGAFQPNYYRIFHFARLWDGSNFIGFSLLGLDFYDDGVNDPSFNLNDGFKFRTIGTDNGDQPKMLLYGNNEQELFLSSYIGGKFLLSRILGLTGTAVWTF